MRYKTVLITRSASLFSDTIREMEKLSIERCRELIGGDDDLTDGQVEELRDRLYVVADVIADAFSDLTNLDPALLQPPGTISEQLEALNPKAEQ
jgi:hypothetical protein